MDFQNDDEDEPDASSSLGGGGGGGVVWIPSEGGGGEEEDSGRRSCNGVVLIKSIFSLSRRVLLDMKRADDRRDDWHVVPLLVFGDRDRHE